ncbi:MAG TPA: hypothetical protein EYN67_08820 [Flavobacteriales bacterium]|nr:hypothetical protein [Flavobacteriales bacterium]
MELENKDLQNPVETNTGLKELVVDYIGNCLQAEDETVTVDMAVQVFAAEFPEFLMAIAEENFLRGYEQALTDVENSPQRSE